MKTEEYKKLMNQAQANMQAVLLEAENPESFNNAPISSAIAKGTYCGKEYQIKIVLTTDENEFIKCDSVPTIEVL